MCASVHVCGREGKQKEKTRGFVQERGFLKPICDYTVCMCVCVCSRQEVGSITSRC